MRTRCDKLISALFRVSTLDTEDTVPTPKPYAQDKRCVAVVGSHLQLTCCGSDGLVVAVLVEAVAVGGNDDVDWISTPLLGQSV